MEELFRHFRFVPVVALLVAAAVLATPPNRLPLALRGLQKVLGRPSAPRGPEASVTPLRRLFAFVLVLAAFVLAVC